MSFDVSPVNNFDSNQYVHGPLFYQKLSGIFKLKVFLSCIDFLDVRKQHNIFSICFNGPSRLFHSFWTMGNTLWKTTQYMHKQNFAFCMWPEQGLNQQWWDGKKLSPLQSDSIDLFCNSDQNHRISFIFLYFVCVCV